MFLCLLAKIKEKKNSAHDFRGFSLRSAVSTYRLLHREVEPHNDKKSVILDDCVCVYTHAHVNPLKAHLSNPHPTISTYLTHFHFVPLNLSILSFAVN